MKNPYMPLIIGIMIAGMFNAEEHPEGAAACARARYLLLLPRRRASQLLSVEPCFSSLSGTLRPFGSYDSDGRLISHTKKSEGFHSLVIYSV